MAAKRTAATDANSQSPTKPGRKIAEFGILIWMIGITVLWWLLYGPGMTFITERLGILAGLRVLRANLMQFFTFTSWY
jgi:hypothetical protein